MSAYDLPSMKPTTDGMTEGQRNFILDLLVAVRGPLPECFSLIDMSKREASEMIDDLKRQRQAKWDAERLASHEASLDARSVPDGRYAVWLHDDDAATLKFYRVKTPTEGKWAGFTFLDAQGGGTFYPIRNKEHKIKVLDKIAADPKAALQLYGQQLGVCGVCGRELTDETSRAIGIGPICREGF